MAWSLDHNSKKEKNLELRLVNLEDSNVEKKLQKNIDKSRSFYQLNFNGCDSQKIHSDEDAWDLSEHLLDQAAVMFAFEQVGGCLLYTSDAADE